MVISHLPDYRFLSSDMEANVEGLILDDTPSGAAAGCMACYAENASDNLMNWLATS